jgi:hypothetical protein
MEASRARVNSSKIGASKEAEAEGERRRGEREEGDAGDEGRGFGRDDARESSFYPI